MPVRKIPSAWFASLPSMHEIVPVASKTSFYVDETRSAVDLNPGDIFAELHLIDGRLKICPTTNLPLDVEEVFLCHDGQPNVIIKPFKRVIEVGHLGIKKGEVLKCRCTANTCVQFENNIQPAANSRKICDHMGFFFGGENLDLGASQTSSVLGFNANYQHGAEHTEIGGGFFVGDIGGYEAEEGEEKKGYAGAF